MSSKLYEFFWGFASANRLTRRDAEERWYWYAHCVRCLSDEERKKLESGGYRSGYEMGKAYRQEVVMARRMQ